MNRPVKGSLREVPWTFRVCHAELDALSRNAAPLDGAQLTVENPGQRFEIIAYRAVSRDSMTAETASYFANFEGIGRGLPCLRRRGCTPLSLSQQLRRS